MNCFKKAVVSCALIATMINPARSAVGISFAAPIAVVAGVAAMAVSGAAGYGSYRLIKKGTTGTIIAGVAAGIVSAGGAYFGFLLLDGNQKAQFSELDEKTAAEMGIAASEAAIYNSEVEQVNAIAREIGAELVQQNSESPELAREMWMELGTQLSPETMKTVITIAQQGQ